MDYNKKWKGEAPMGNRADHLTAAREYGKEAVRTVEGRAPYTPLAISSFADVSFLAAARARTAAHHAIAYLRLRTAAHNRSYRNAAREDAGLVRGRDSLGRTIWK